MTIESQSDIVALQRIGRIVSLILQETKGTGVELFQCVNETGTEPK